MLTNNDCSWIWVYENTGWFCDVTEIAAVSEITTDTDGGHSFLVTLKNGTNRNMWYCSLKLAEKALSCLVDKMVWPYDPAHPNNIEKLLNNRKQMEVLND